MHFQSWFTNGFTIEYYLQKHHFKGSLMVEEIQFMLPLLFLPESTKGFHLRKFLRPVGTNMLEYFVSNNIEKHCLLVHEYENEHLTSWKVSSWKVKYGYFFIGKKYPYFKFQDDNFQLVRHSFSYPCRQKIWIWITRVWIPLHSRGLTSSCLHHR